METRKCSCCGRELPLDNFIRRQYGMSKICRECNGKRIKAAKDEKARVANLENAVEEAKKMRIQDFSPRELMVELARRGYKGKLYFTYTEVKESDITKL